MRTASNLTGVLLALAMSLAAGASVAQDYDLVINNGRVMDPETMRDEIANVGVKGGRIAAITREKIQGKQTIDATGHVVAPGFIDTHCHSIEPVSTRLVILDGVTTCIDFEAGATDIDTWYANKQGKWPVNYGTPISQELLRGQIHDPEVKQKGADDSNTIFKIRAEACKDGVCGWQDTVSTLEQINQLNKLLDEGLRQGALGIGALVGYARDGISTLELYEAQKTAARYGRPLSMHSRFHGNSKPPTEGQLGFDEVLVNALTLGAPLIYAHDNQYGWWENEEKLQAARARGANVWAEYYPYAAASTSVNATFLKPEGLKAIGIEYKDVYDPITDKRLTLESYQQLMKEDPAREIIAFVPANQGWPQYWLRMPHMTVASDSMWNYDTTWDTPVESFVGHPRTSGSRGTVLELGRKYNVPLMFSLAQMSYWSAKHLGDTGLKAMQERGRMQVGMVADITIFDPLKAKAESTFKQGEQGRPTSGIPYVIVNGQIVVKESKFQKVWAGQPIRFPVEAKGTNPFRPSNGSNASPSTFRRWTIQPSGRTALAPKAPNGNEPGPRRGLAGSGGQGRPAVCRRRMVLRAGGHRVLCGGKRGSRVGDGRYGARTASISENGEVRDVRAAGRHRHDDGANRGTPRVGQCSETHH